MENSLGVPVKVDNFRAAGILPKAELVFAEPMRTQDLLVFLVPDEGADLAVGVHSADVLAGFDVPETHGLVRSSSSGC